MGPGVGDKQTLFRMWDYLHFLTCILCTWMLVFCTFLLFYASKLYFKVSDADETSDISVMVQSLLPLPWFLLLHRSPCDKSWKGLCNSGHGWQIRIMLKKWKKKKKSVCCDVHVKMVGFYSRSQFETVRAEQGLVFPVSGLLRLFLCVKWIDI